MTFLGNRHNINALPEDVYHLLVVLTNKMRQVPEASKIVLYGSYAKAAWNHQSDIDLAVFLRHNREGI